MKATPPDNQISPLFPSALCFYLAKVMKAVSVLGLTARLNSFCNILGLMTRLVLNFYSIRDLRKGLVEYLSEKGECCRGSAKGTRC